MPISNTPNAESLRYCHRFFDRVGHETMYAFSGNKHFLMNNVTYQNYEQSQQKLGIFLENKVFQKSKF